MAVRMVHFSDLSGATINDDTDVVRLVVEQHPLLQNGPVELEIMIGEADVVRKNALNVVNVKLFHGDGSEPEAVTMEIEAFNQLANGMDMEDVLDRAEPAYAPRKRTAPASAPAGEKLDYASLEHAGKPHRGKTTEAEKRVIRENLQIVNERLRSEGIRTIDLNNAEHVSRYGLEELAGKS